MPKAPASDLRALIDRLARLAASEGWRQDLNPAQGAALGYLARANRFSRAPSHLASYLGATRGTVSQTLKTLERKGLVALRRSSRDARSLSCELSEAGREAARGYDTLGAAVRRLARDEAAVLGGGLEALLAVLAERGGRSFGICRTCRHHEPRGEGGVCRLLTVDLPPHETGQICQEHSASRQGA